MLGGEIVATLGKGRFGRIRLLKTSSENYLACKDYNRMKAISEGYVNRILQEKAILQTLSNPYIMKYFDTSKDDESLYLYLEPVLGGGLHLHIQQTNGFSLTLCRFYLTQLISAVEYLGERAVVHRDLKANNILLTAKGHIKICDFGSAKQLTLQSNSPVEYSKTLTVIGSAHIMAPEMICKPSNHTEISNSQGYDCTVDWWAIGVLFMEMIYGTLPTVDQLNALHSIPLEAVYSSSSPSPSSASDSQLNFWTLCGHSSEDLSPQWNKTNLLDFKSSHQMDLSEEELATGIDILQRFLSIPLSSRWNINRKEELFCHPFFQERVDWSQVRGGNCRDIEIDRRLGFLEILEAGVGGGAGGGGGEDEISQSEQALFEGF